MIFYVSSWLYPTATVGYTAKFYWFKNRYEKLEAAQRFPVKGKQSIDIQNVLKKV